MATASLKNRRELDPAITTRLTSLRRRIRQYVWAEGIALAVTWLGAAFWLSLAADWFFEPSVPVRLLMLAALFGVLAAIIVKRLGRRAFVRLAEGNLAMLLERRFPQLDDSLLTAVVLSHREPDPSDCDPQMLDETRREAARRIQSVSVGAVFNLQPLRQGVLAALLMTLSVTLFAVIFPASFGVWSRRTLALADQLWPRLVHLEIDGFPGGVRKVGRGSDAEITVRAEARNHKIPPMVQIRFRDPNGGRSQVTMDRIGRIDPRKDAYQSFTYTRRNLLAPLRLDVFGGDDALRDLRLEVVENPTIRDWSLRCAFPAYLGRPPRTLPATGVVPLPQGARVTVRATANKDLVGVQVDTVVDGKAVDPPRVITGNALGSDRRSFTFTLPVLNKDTTLLFTLSDADGIKSREPVRLDLAAVADQPPQVAAQLDGIGTAITPLARVAVAGRATDDYALDRLWFECQIDEGTPKKAAVRTLDRRPAEFPLEGLALEVEPFHLRPGQKFFVSLRASDRCDLKKTPNVGGSDRWLLDVVTPEQLLAMLEARELVLRQQFEKIIRETTETRDLLARWESADSERTQPALGAEPGEQPDASPERRLDRQSFSLGRAITNCRKNASETLGLADSFDDVRKQLVNNRLDTEELKERLERRIADPLRTIARESFPELDRRLERFQTALEQKSLPTADCRRQAWEQADAVLLAMQKVLDRMLQLESYHEAVELLREIIQLQEQLHRRTEARQKQKLKDLLKE
ncbi:MAG: hypothetical protein JXB10_11885 [Pirellulales bacterium]|nr:hypothetical protein [Pirellulales bacterium]